MHVRLKFHIGISAAGQLLYVHVQCHVITFNVITHSLNWLLVHKSLRILHVSVTSIAHEQTDFRIGLFYNVYPRPVVLVQIVGWLYPVSTKLPLGVIRIVWNSNVVSEGRLVLHWIQNFQFTADSFLVGTPYRFEINGDSGGLLGAFEVSEEVLVI